MDDLPIEQIVALAKEFDKEGKKWHVHMITPKCQFNSNKEKHAFFLENESENLYSVNYSDYCHIDESKELVQLLQGRKITQDHSEPILDENLDKILERAQDLNEKGISWHNHMFFPNCIFNKHKGQGGISFEDPKNQVLETISEIEPKESLSKIEILFYAQEN